MATRQVCISSRIQPVNNVINRNQISVNLTQPIVCPRGYDIYCTLVDSQIPNSYNAVDENNNVITLTARYGTLSTQITTTIPVGNYTAATLVTAWGAARGRLINFTLGGAACTSNISLTASNSFFTLKVNSVTGVPSGAGASPSWSFDINNNVLGFVNQSFTTTATKAYCAPNFSPRYYIIASSLNTFNQFPAAGLEVPVRILGRVPCTAASGYIETYTNPGLSPLKLADRVISNFDITLLNDLAKPINLLGYDWSCALQFEFIAKIELRGDYWNDEE